MAWYRLNQAFRRRISEAGLTPDQFTLLRTLMEHDAKGLTQRELTRLMASDPNTISSLVQRMEAAGMVDRVPHESDRRALRIRILPAGAEAYEAMRPVALKLQAEILEALPEADREPFLANLEKVALAARDAARNTILMEKSARERASGEEEAEDDPGDDVTKDF